MNLYCEGRHYISDQMKVTVHIDVTPADDQYDKQVDYTISTEPECACKEAEPGTLCGPCWLRECVQCAGIKQIVMPDAPDPKETCDVVLVGYMKSSTSYDAYNGDWDGEDWFEEVKP